MTGYVLNQNEVSGGGGCMSSDVGNCRNIWVRSGNYQTIWGQGGNNPLKLVKVSRKCLEVEIDE